MAAILFLGQGGGNKSEAQFYKYKHNNLFVQVPQLLIVTHNTNFVNNLGGLN